MFHNPSSKCICEDITTDNYIYIYIYRLQHKDVFDFIRQYNLYDNVQKLVIPLLDLDTTEALNLLVKRREIAPEVIIEHLEQQKQPRYLYLVSWNEEFFKRGENIMNYHLIQLFCCCSSSWLWKKWIIAVFTIGNC